MRPVWATAGSHVRFIGFYLGYSKDKGYKKRLLVWSRDGGVGSLSFKGFKIGQVKWKLTSACPESVDYPEPPQTDSVETAIESYIETLKPAPKGSIIIC